jgi:curved DNA-binding protein CbpA
MAMAAAGHGGPVPDLYRLLGVPPGASGGEITRAWRRQALAEHPDSRPGDAGAPARFRALAEAYQVLSDPARRAAYDRTLADRRDPGAAAPGEPAAGAAGGWRAPGAPVTVRPAGRVPGPPLRAGPVRVDAPRPTSADGPRVADDGLARLAALAELAAWYLADDRGWPW